VLPPTWREVREVLAIPAANRAEIRANAILSLLTRYGLRASEVIQLRLADLNWKAKTLNVRRSKSSGFQRFPIERDTAASVLRYVMNVRPNCSCPHLFVTLNPPFRPLCVSSLWLITSARFERLGIHCRPRGPHSLRHACARRLLRRGLSHKEISDFLGHHNLHTVRIYARCDMKSLRSVADFDLGGLT
jgi:integrase/recombinase XerD